MSSAQRILIFGGLLLAALGMLYGLYYALFAEHQTLDGMGTSLTQAFIAATERRLPDRTTALESYTGTKYIYVRQVDVHSHWIGLAMVLIILGASFDQVGLAERHRLWIAIMLLIGAVVFPLGVWLQTVVSGRLPPAVAILGCVLVTAGLVFTIFGFARSKAPVSTKRSSGDGN
jgi:dipeptide/tripeptide permease